MQSSKLGSRFLVGVWSVVVAIPDAVPKLSLRIAVKQCLGQWPENWMHQNEDRRVVWQLSAPCSSRGKHPSSWPRQPHEGPGWEAPRFKRDYVSCVDQWADEVLENESVKCLGKQKHRAALVHAGDGSRQRPR